MAPDAMHAKEGSVSTSRQPAVITAADHPQRAALNAELHSRPPIPLTTPARLSQMSYVSGVAGEPDDRARVERLCERLSVKPTLASDRQIVVACEAFTLKWERHVEFSSYTVIAAGAAPVLFAAPALDALPADWLAEVGGDRIAAVHVELVSANGGELPAEAVDAAFDMGPPVAALVADGHARVLADFQMHRDGFGRILVEDRGLTPGRAGRLVQRLVEIETYRMIALLGFPLAKELMRDLDRLEDRLGQVVTDVTHPSDDRSDRAILGDILAISAEVEALAARSMFRFAAARAYHTLVRRRCEELREERVQSLQRISNFLDRRLGPAMRTVEAAAGRLDNLSRRIARTADLMRTRVDLTLEEQNQELLKSMDRRATLQLRLQHTIEGLSVVAISYYAIGVASTLVKAVAEAGLAINHTLVTGLIAPFIILGTIIGVHRIRRTIVRAEKEGD